MAEPAESNDKQNLFSNSGLFSNHYLENMIQKSPVWNDDASLAEVYSAIRDIYIKKSRNFERYVEADLEHNWIRPVLDRLGHYYGVQESVHQDPLKPDYAFFADKEALDEAYSHKKGSDDFYKNAVAVGDAKAWNVALDKSRQGKVLREAANPSLQIDNYLRATPPKWAILTNGRLWRLYHEDTSFKLDCFYEVNLPELMEQVERTGKKEPFKYFYLFFRRQAFPEEPLGSSFLDRVRQESLAYAQKVGSDLQENVYRAMKILAEGFFAEPSNSLSHSEEDIREVQDNSMRLLYRLLFIFYAESRKLLDTDNRRYREMSLKKLKEEIAEKLDQGEAPLAVRSTYWEGLRDLFRLINDGSEAFGYSREEFYIPAYNGGLFDPVKNPFLSGKKIGNSYLAEALDLLARSDGERGKAYVDYSSLDIRHLGSIYEGILEYRLHLAGEGMAAVREKGKEVWLAQSQVGARKVTDRVEAGRLYLVTDKGERKATGSFYTPEYIVKYIVKNTLGPLIDKMMEEAMMSADLRPGLLKKLLSLKVLDPAMGSGHFLVEATDYIAREIIHAREMARQEELESEAVAEADIHWARREVVRNCIYGVDLNPMAVELAKLSLWLTTVAANKPLSFLDHHLRCGNSLIGAELENLAVLPGRPSEDTPLWSFGLRSHTEKLLKKYSLMAALPDDSLAMVKWKEDQFRQIKEGELSKRMAELANVWLSTYFGNKVSEDDYFEMQNQINPEKFPDWSALRSQEWFLRAQELAQAKRFFHWELEFPEAFQGENRGFDVVIGNPPYANAWTMTGLDDLVRNAIVSCCQRKEIMSGHWDLYIPFVALSLKVLRRGGYHSFILPDAVAREKYASNLRIALVNDTTLVRWTHFEGENVFDDVSRHCVIYVITNQDPLPDWEVILESPPSRDFASRTLNKVPLAEWLVGPTSQFRPKIGRVETSNILGLIDNLSVRLGQYCYVMVGATVHSKDGKSFKKADVISKTPTGNAKRFFDGKTLQRYEILLDGRFLDYRREEMYGPRVPELFENQKIVVRDVTAKNEKLVVSYDDTGLYCDHLVTCVTFYKNIEGTGAQTEFEGYPRIENDIPELRYILAVVASSLIAWYFREIFATGTLQGSYSHTYPKQVRDFPIRRISFTTPAEERARLGAELQDLYAQGKHAEILAAVNGCLPQDEAGNFIAESERSDVVHDLLAFLAERMLEMNKEKQQEIRGFLGWLEGYVGAKVEELTPKTRLQSYYEHDYESLLAVLKKNRKKLAVDPARREPAEALRAEFEGSMNKLLPLLERIEKTDRLIDAVVYRLYGLTEEEIGIVEGRTGDGVH